MQNFYQLEDEQSKYYDEEGKFKWDAQSSSEEDAQLSESSEEIEEVKPSKRLTDDEESEPEDDLQPKVVSDSEIQIGKRLALTNMDWDNISATDLLALFTSLCKGGEMIVKKVQIFPSLYGIEQMKNDVLYGPPKDLFQTEEQPKKSKRKEDDDEENADAFDQKALRKYELDKMKYFYAVVHFNSGQTAERIYNEYNDYEFELSNIRLNLSFIADDLKFPQQPKETATEIPPDYEFSASSSLNRAMNHTSVKLTWDETDPKRLRKFQKIMQANPDDISEDEYKEFLASGTESEGEAQEHIDRDKVEEYRQKLLGALSDNKTDDPFRKRALQQSDDEDLDIKFGVGFGEDIGEKVLKEKKERK